MGLDTRFTWAHDGAAFRARHPRLRELDDVTVTGLGARATTGPWHLLYRGVDAVPSLRSALRLHRYAF